MKTNLKEIECPCGLIQLAQNRVQWWDNPHQFRIPYLIVSHSVCFEVSLNVCNIFN